MKKTNPNTKAMEEALQSAVARMQTGSMNPGPSMGAPDPINMVMAVLPKLLEGSGGREDLLDKVEELQQVDLAGIKKQLEAQTQLLERMLRACKMVSLRQRTFEENQRAIEGAVHELAEQMERVQILEELPDDEEGYDEPSRPFEAQRPKLRLAHVRARQKSAR